MDVLDRLNTILQKCKDANNEMQGYEILAEGVDELIDELRYGRNMPKKYVIFAFEDCYPAGGLGDLRDESFDTLEEAKIFAESLCFDNIQIVDRDTFDYL